MSDELDFDNLSEYPKTRDFFERKMSRSSPVFLVVLALILLSIIIWANFAKLDDTVKANAVLRPLDNISYEKILGSGEVITKAYEHNSKVKTGDFLLKLDTTAFEHELQTYKNQLEFYENELKNFNELLNYINNEKYTVNNSIDNLKIDMYRLEKEQKYSEVVSIKKELDREKNLPAVMQTQQKINELEEKYRLSLKSYDSYIYRQKINCEETVNKYVEQKNACVVKIAAIERQIKNCSVYAPIDGYINEIIEINVGEYLLSGNEILKIIPEKQDVLKAQIMVEASQAARVKIGQVAKLRFPGLPPSSFGQLETSINYVPADIVLYNDSMFFQIESVLENPYMTSYRGEKIKLKSGLSCEARIVISRDAVIKMVLRKLDFMN
ncbi:MAG: HlyD family secretion protein [Treponema sp.]|nr:HlyD family secretion protein [Treponema sp.]